MNPNAGVGGRGELRVRAGPQPMIISVHRSPNTVNFGVLTQYLTNGHCQHCSCRSSLGERISYALPTTVYNETKLQFTPIMYAIHILYQPSTSPTLFPIHIFKKILIQSRNYPVTHNSPSPKYFASSFSFSQFSFNEFKFFSFPFRLHVLCSVSYIFFTHPNLCSSCGFYPVPSFTGLVYSVNTFYKGFKVKSL
jgi:hypothetical protein